MKQVVPKDKLVTAGQGWAEDFSPTTIRLIGLAEILGAIGLVLPAALHIAPVLVPLAAVGFALVMVGPAAVHAQRKEMPMVAMNGSFSCSPWSSCCGASGRAMELTIARGGPYR